MYLEKAWVAVFGSSVLCKVFLWILKSPDDPNSVRAEKEKMESYPKVMHFGYERGVRRS